MTRAHIRAADVGDRRAAQIDAALRRTPTYSLFTADTADEAAAARPARRGKGQRCEHLGCDREGVKWLGAWRCGICPEPRALDIAAELDPTERDPRKRWPRRAWRTVANTVRHEDLMEESA